MYFVALLFAKIVDTTIKVLRLGAGSTWPGEIAVRIFPHFVRTSIARNNINVILIAGTNGKTTTSLLLVHGLRKLGTSCITNPEGANLLNGVASSLVRSSTLLGTINHEYAVFEVDENAFVHVVEEVKSPTHVVLLNLFRDQLDRYGEVHVIAKKWKETLSKLSKSTLLIVNGDDPLLGHVGTAHRNTVYFGAHESEKTSKHLGHDVDSVFCPVCGNKLQYEGISYSHMGNYHCDSCSYKTPKEDNDEMSDLPHFKGIYNRYNLRAVCLVLKDVFGLNIHNIFNILSDAYPAFGRQELLEYDGKKWIIMLSKNPAGFNQSIRAIGELGISTTSVLIILNDRIPDGTDVSWIWDVDFEHVLPHARALYVTGDRTYDMALRMETALEFESKKLKINNQILKAVEDIKSAVAIVSLKHDSDEPIVVLATYTGMLEIRKLLKGRSLL